jgi:hypothetical protein
MRMMVEALEAAATRGPLKQWEAVCIQTFWKAHFGHVHSHHTNEDAILVPYLQTRFKYPEKVGPTTDGGGAVMLIVFCHFLVRQGSHVSFLACY